MASQNEIRQRITDQIIEALKAGTPPWRRPWSALENSGFPTNIVSRRCYSGVNPLLLQMVAHARGYQSKFWGTFNQWTGLGAKVKKRPADMRPGCWGTRIVFFKPITKKAKTDDGDEETSKFLVLREFVVFNLDQVEGECLDHLRPKPRSISSFVDYEPAQKVIDATHADIRYGGDRAFYSRTGDFIQVPLRETFDGAQEFYATHFHELAHWAYRPRLNLEASYAFEELVAEIAACYLSSEIGIPQSDDLSNHHAYLASWLKELENDSKAIFRAATQASKAADFILAFSRPQESEGEAIPAQEEVGGAA